MAERIILAVADSLEEAKEQLESQIPEGFDVVSQEIVSQGKRRTVKASGDTLETALAKAQRQVPSEAQVVEKREIPPEQKPIERVVEAFDEVSAKVATGIVPTNRLTIKGVRLLAEGSKGFLGIGRKPNQYAVELVEHVPATVEITYKTPASIAAKIRKLEAGEIACPRCGHPFVPPRMTVTTHAIIAKYGPNPTQCPSCKHIWSRPSTDDLATYHLGP
jgi:hypothetical protein